jgi:hypothetical protein
MNQIDTLEEAIVLSQEMLSLLDEQDLEKISDLEHQRDLIIKRVFTDTAEPVDRDKVNYLQNLNQQIVDKLHYSKASVLLKIKQIRKSNKATQAYSNNQN